MENELAPPWTKFEWPQGSMGWRMGPGESCMNEWVSWFRSLSKKDKDQYIASYPTPDDWIMFYEITSEQDINKRRELFHQHSIEREKWLEKEFSLYLELKDKDIDKALKHLDKVATYNGKYKDSSTIFNSYVKKS